ncbi:MAG: response regulator [Salibacteraceae bacterium]
MIRIALVDDHLLFRKGMASLIEKMEAVHLAVEASNGQEFLDALEKTPIDLVLLDLKMPILDGHHTLNELRSSGSDIKVIFLTMETGEEVILRCMENGANGFLAKDAHPNEVRLAIQKAVEEGMYVNAHTARIMQQGLSQWKSGHRNPEVQLTERELTVLQGICLQKSTAQIAEELFVSPRTVEGYRRTLLEKVNTKNSLGLVLFASKQGWLDRWLAE